MSDYDTELQLGLNRMLSGQVDGATRSINLMVNAIDSIDTEAMQGLGFEKGQIQSIHQFIGAVKDANKQLSVMKSLISQTGARSLHDALQVEQYRTQFLDQRTGSYQTKALMATPAEQRMMVKGVALAIKDAMASNDTRLSNQLTGFQQQLNRTMSHNERVLGMTTKEREAQKGEAALKKQQLQNQRELSKFLGQAKSSNTHSVLPNGTDLSMLGTVDQKRAMKAQQVYADNLRLGGSRDQARQAEKVMADLEKQYANLIEKRKKETTELRSQERLQQSIANKDSRAAGNASERYDNVRAGKLGAYSTSRYDREGIRQLKEQIKLREQNLKLLKAEAVTKSSAKLDKQIVKEEKRLGRLRDLEAQLKQTAAAERNYAMASSPTNIKQRAELARKQGRETRFGDGGAELFRTQAGLLGNYAVMGAGVGGMYQGIQFTLDLDASMRQLQAILALTNGELTQMSEHLIDVSEKTKFTALDVMEAATIMGQAGFSPDQINASIESTTYLATAIGSDLKTAVDLQTSVMGVYDKSAGQMMDVSDKIVTAINTSKLNLEKLTLGMQYSGNISSQLGVSFEENMAALGAMANSGIRSGSTLGTGMRQVYTALQKPSASFLKWMDSVGLSMEDVSVKTRGLYNVMETLKEAGFDMDSASKMWETRAASAVGAIFNNMSKFKELMQDFDTSTGAAAAANQSQMQATRNQLERLYSISGTIYAEAVEPMRLAFTDIVKLTADMLSDMREFKGLTQAVTTLLAGWGIGKGTGALFSLLKNLMVEGGSTGGKGLGGKALGGAASRMMRSAGVWGMVGTAALSAGSYYFNDKRREQDTLDQAQTKLSENLRLYTEQQNAIRKVTHSLYEMGTKQDLFTNDQEALRRYTDNLKSEFGGLGLVLTGVEGDFNKTRGALDEFRAALQLATANGLPTQSYQAVIDEQAKQLGHVQTFSRGRAELDFFGAETAKINGTWTSGNAYNPKLAKYLQDYGHTPSVKAYLKGTNLLVAGADGRSPLSKLDPNDKAGIQTMLSTIVDAKNSLRLMGQMGVINTNEDTGPFANLGEQFDMAITSLGGLNKTHGDLKNIQDKVALEGFSSTMQERFGDRGMTITNGMHNMVRNTKGLNRAAPDDPVAQARLIVNSYDPFIDQMLELREDMKAFVKDYDKTNGTNFGDSMGEFAAWTTIGKEITDVQGKLKDANKTIDKYDQLDAKWQNQSIDKQKVRLQYLLGQTDDLLEVTRLENELHGLFEQQATNSLKGQKPDTEEYDMMKRELGKQVDESKKLVSAKADAQRRKIESAQRRKQNKAFNALVTAEGMTADTEVERLRTELRYANTPDDAKAIGERLVDAIAAEGTATYNSLIKSLDGVPAGVLDKIEAEVSKGTQNKVSKAQSDIDQRISQIEAGILRRNKAEIKQGLTLEKAQMDAYFAGEGRVMGDKYRNMTGDLNNSYSLLRAKSTTSEQFEMTVATIDEQLGRIIQLKREQIIALEKDPAIRTKRLAELAETERVLRDQSAIRINGARDLRAARAAGQDNESRLQWSNDLNHQWGLIRKGLQAGTNERGAALTNSRNLSNANKSQRDYMQGMLGVANMDPAFYAPIQGGLDKLEAGRIQAVGQAYDKVYADIDKDKANLEELQAQYQATLGAGGLHPEIVKTYETLIANIAKEIERLNKEQEGAQLKQDDDERSSERYQREVDTRVQNQTFFNGSYKSRDARNQQARIHGGTVYGADGSEAQYNPNGVQDLEEMAQVWQTLENSAAEYGRQLERSYGNYDAMTDSVNRLADATEQAANQAAGLFADWAMGTKEADDAVKELAASVLQMLTQIAMQVAVNSAVSAIVGGGGSAGATGGKVRRATGGVVPHTGGSKGQDSVNAQLMPGEWVIRSSVARRLGDDTMAAINNGSLDPTKVQGAAVNNNVQQGPKELNVWVVSDPKDAGNGGIGPNDVVAIVEDNVSRRGSLRTLIKQVALN